MLVPLKDAEGDEGAGDAADDGDDSGVHVICLHCVMFSGEMCPASVSVLPMTADVFATVVMGVTAGVALGVFVYVLEVA